MFARFQSLIWLVLGGTALCGFVGLEFGLIDGLIAACLSFLPAATGFWFLKRNRFTEGMKGIASAHLLRATLDSMGEAVLSISPSGNVVFANAAARELFGRSILGRSCLVDDETNFERKEDNPFHWLRKLFQGEPCRDKELLLRKEAGSPKIPALLNARAIENFFGRPMGFVAIFTDMTRQKQVENQLRVAKQELEVNVAERTFELQEANRTLESQLADLKRVQEERTRLLMAEQSARAAVEDAHARFKLIAKATNDGLWDWNLRTNEIWWGENIYSLFGFPIEVVGNDISWWYENVHPDDRVRIVSGIHTVIRNGEQFWVDEYRYRRSDGSYAHLLDRGFVAYDAEARPVRMIGAMMDITARKCAQDEVARLAAIVQYSNDAVISLDMNDHVVSWNKSAEKIFGYSASEMIGQSIGVISPDNPVESEELSERVRRGDRIEDFETVRVRKDGTRMDVSMTISPVKDTSGAMSGISAIIRDISERKAIERQSQLQAQMLSLVNDVVIATDLNHQITYWNSAAERLFGVPASESIGIPRSQLIQFDPADWHYDPFHEVLQRGGSWVGERVTFGRQGEKAYVEISISLLSDDLTRPLGLLIVMHDFTAREETQEKLKTQAKELSRSNEELIQFAYVASHDLKEPLRMVTNFVQLLARRYKGKLDPDADDYIQYAVEGALRMYELINDLLIYSRVGMRGEGVFRSIDCNEVFETANNNLQVSVRESGATVLCDPLPVITADPTQMVQLFQNLLSNAIKFRGNHKPEVHLKADLISREWVFTVQDNGIGIDPRFGERIFIIFQRLHNREDYPGTGIGLAICKKIVERHGGRIWVESKPGCGATFKFTLPAQRSRISGPIKEKSAEHVPLSHAQLIGF